MGGFTIKHTSRAALLISLLCAPQALATDGDTVRGFVSGNDLYLKCTNTDKLFCLGYIAGMSDAMQTSSAICIPEQAVLRQPVDVVLNFLRAHPESRHISAVTLVGTASSARVFLPLKAASPFP